MPTCSNHHESQASDFCTICGIEISPANSSPDQIPPETAGSTECPKCHAERAPDGGDFCEICGFNFKTGRTGFPFAAEDAPPTIPPIPARPIPLEPEPSVFPEPLEAPQLRWELLATIDLSVTGVPEAEGPADRDERIFPLDLPEQLIGRRSPRRGISPEIAIDSDDSVSHRHARIMRQPDGGFAILDLGSSNGTLLNGVRLKANVLASIRDGDRITLGRWTCLTLRARS